MENHQTNGGVQQAELITANSIWSPRITTIDHY